MFPELVNDFVHLERSRDSFDEDGSTNASTRYSEKILRHAEDVVPETSFEVVFHLGEALEREHRFKISKTSSTFKREQDVLEVRSVASSEKLFGIVEEVETEIEDRTRHRLTVYKNVVLVEVPSTCTDQKVNDQYCRVVE